MMYRIWTRAYRPFVMGGSVNQPVAAEVEVEGPFDLGKGFQGYIVRAPNGSTVVAEAISGGIVGDTLLSVRADIAEGDLAVMQQQVQEQAEIGKTADLLTPENFWQLMRRGAT